MKIKNLLKKAKAPQRTLEEVKSDYQNQCAILGDVTYRLSQLKKDQEAMLARLKELNQEASAIPKVEAPAEVKAEEVQSGNETTN